MSENNMTLEQMMGRQPRTGTTIDLTAGNVQKETPSVTAIDLTARPTEEEAAPKQFKATAQSQAIGNIDLSKATPINVHEILPSKKDTIEDSPLMAELDLAVEAEMKKIDERIDAVLDAQDNERQDAADKEMMAKQEAEDHANTNGTSFSAGEEEDDLGLYDDVAEEASYNRTSVSMFDEADDGHHEPIITTKDISDEADMPFTVSEPEKETLKMEIEAVDTTIPVVEEEKKPEVAAPAPVVRPVSILDGVADKDLFDEESEGSSDGAENTEDVDKLIEDLKAEVKAKVTPIRKKIDLSGFSIAKKAEGVQKVMKLAVHSHRNVADWAMVSAGRPVSMTGLSGPEILKLNPENTGRNRLNTFRDMYRIIYEHVYDANKPDFEVWLKQTRFVDLQHIYFGLYMATFGGSNFMSFTCPNNKCGKVFIKDIEFKDMVEYASDEVKAKVQGILRLDSTSASKDSYDVDMVQISDSYVFGLRTPSVWNVIIETASLSDKFLEQHSDLIDVVAYIDSIYYIDHDAQQLVPVDTKPDPNDQAKSSARRIKAFYDVINSLSSEEYYALRAQIGEYDKKADQVKYLIPSCTCPDCATEVPANRNVTPDTMLFTRHQLAVIGNM